MNRRTWLLAVSIAFVGGCQRNPPSPGQAVVGEVGYGTISGHTYSNDFFGLEVAFPDNWYIQSREEFDEIRKRGEQVVGANKNLKAAVQAAQATTLNLISAFEHPPGTPVLFNANIMLMAEKVKHLPGIRNGGDYLELMKRTMGMTAIKYEFDAVESGHKLGNLDTHCLPARMMLGTQKVHQRIYATRTGDYVLVISCSYGSDEQLEIIKGVLAKAKGGADKRQ